MKQKNLWLSQGSGKLDSYPSAEESDSTKIRESDSKKKITFHNEKTHQTLESDSTQLKSLKNKSLSIILNVLL